MFKNLIRDMKDEKDKSQTLGIGKYSVWSKNTIDQINDKLYIEIIQNDISELENLEIETTQRKPRERKKWEEMGTVGQF